MKITVCYGGPENEKVEIKNLYLDPLDWMGPAKRAEAKKLGFRWDGEIWLKPVGLRLYSREFDKALAAGLKPTESGDVDWANCPPED